MKSARAVAAEVLADILQRRGSLSALLPTALTQVPEQERALLQQLCYGTCRFLPSLQAYCQALLHKPIATHDQDIKGLLLLGLYQLEHSRIPEHAIISQTVEAAEDLNKPWTKSLINGVLRSFQRDKNALNIGNQPEVRFNHPQWLIDRLKGAWPDNWEAILEQNNHQAPMTLRVNTISVSCETYLAQLADAGISAHAGKLSPAAITLDSACDVTLLPGFSDGMVSVQDEAAQLAAYLLDLAPDQKVLDACAAPGGKTCHILETEPRIAELTALDQSEVRLKRVHENLARLDLSANTIAADAASPEWWNGEPFDRILVDAPCSATGVIRRHPDIKYLRLNSDINQLAKLQERIVRNLWTMLKPGGKLVYATCSVLPAENEKLVKKLLKKLSDAQEIKITADWGIERPFGRQFFPQLQGHDGFYYAVLEKLPETGH